MYEEKNMRTAPLYSIDLQKNISNKTNAMFKNININETLSNQYINDLIESTKSGISSIEHILNHFLVKSTATHIKLHKKEIWSI